MSIGVILVAYNTGDVLLDALEALLAAAERPEAPDLRVLVVDNASPDGTEARLAAWAAGRPDAPPRDMPVPPPEGRGAVRLDVRDLGRDGRHAALGTLREGTVGLLLAGANRGFAAGVNLGLETFRAMREVDWYWILNSDAMTEPGTPAALDRAARAAGGRFAAMGGRVLLTDPPGMIQADAGGRIDRWLGRLRPHGLETMAGDGDGDAAAPLDYVSGAHMLVAPAFVDRAGLMPDEYFLFYEEVDWCLRRGDLPLRFVPGAAVHHRNGSSIGSQKARGASDTGPSPTAAYWMFRNRLRFVGRWHPAGLPSTALYSLLKVGQFLARGQRGAARAALAGTLGAPGRPRPPRPRA